MHGRRPGGASQAVDHCFYPRYPTNDHHAQTNLGKSDELINLEEKHFLPRLLV